MRTYDEMDRLILDAIEARSNPLYELKCVQEAMRIAENTGRLACRVIDGRLQALRKAGKIEHRTKAESENGRGGWHIAGEK